MSSDIGTARLARSRFIHDLPFGQHDLPSGLLRCFRRFRGLPERAVNLLGQQAYPKLPGTPIVTAWRIEVAKKLLMVPKNTLTDAAEGAGYASDSAFARVFKKETGLTPAGFKKSAIAVHSSM